MQSRRGGLDSAELVCVKLGQSIDLFIAVYVGESVLALELGFRLCLAELGLVDKLISPILRVLFAIFSSIVHSFVLFILLVACDYACGWFGDN